MSETSAVIPGRLRQGQPGGAVRERAPLNAETEALVKGLTIMKDRLLAINATVHGQPLPRDEGRPRPDKIVSTIADNVSEAQCLMGDCHGLLELLSNAVGAN